MSQDCSPVSVDLSHDLPEANKDGNETPKGKKKKEVPKKPSKKTVINDSSDIDSDDLAKIV